MANVRDMIIQALKDGGFDGLCCDECGCKVDDFGVCCVSENILYCEPGYKHPDGGIFTVKPEGEKHERFEMERDRA